MKRPILTAFVALLIVAGSALATMHFMGDIHELRVSKLHQENGTKDPARKKALLILESENRDRIICWLQQHNGPESNYADGSRSVSRKQPLTLEKATKLMEEQINRDFPEPLRKKS